MRQELNSPGVADSRLFANAAITVVALLLIFASLDDIATDHATTFLAEYTFLVGCAGWLLFVSWSLIRGGHRALGFSSLVALASALWAQHGIGPGMVGRLRPEYIVMPAAYLWFWAVAGAMLWLGYRARKRVNLLFTFADAVEITIEFAVIAVLAASFGLPLFILLIRAVA